MNNRELKLEVVSPTTIKCGHIQWFALDTKLVGKTKALIEENERLRSIIKEAHNILLFGFDTSLTLMKALNKLGEGVEKDEDN